MSEVLPGDYESRLKNKGYKRGYRDAVGTLRDAVADTNKERDPNGIALWLLEYMESVAAEVAAE